MPLAGQLQAPSGREIGALRLANSGGDAGGAKRIFHGGERLRLVPHADLNQALGWKTEASKARGVEIVAAQDPHHLAALAERRGEDGGEGCGDGGRLDLHPLARHLVPAAERQAGAGKTAVHPGIAEGQNSPRDRALQTGESRPHRHETRLARHSDTLYVLFLF